MPLTVTRAGTAPEIIGVQAVFDMLSPETDIGDLLDRTKRREHVPVRFIDGTTGTVGGIDPVVKTTGQSILALLPAGPPRRFELQCKLLVEVATTVWCRARDPRHAQTIVEELFSGLRPAEYDVKVLVNCDAMLDRVRDLDHAFARFENGEARWSHPIRVLIDATNEIDAEIPHANDVGFSGQAAG
jgi:hypothetical protein